MKECQIRILDGCRMEEMKEEKGILKEWRLMEGSNKWTDGMG